MTCTNPVKAQGNVEDWLKRLEDEMKKTVRYYAFDGMGKMRAGMCEPENVQQYVKTQPCQIGLMGVMI